MYSTYSRIVPNTIFWMMNTKYQFNQVFNQVLSFYVVFWRSRTCKFIPQFIFIDDSSMNKHIEVCSKINRNHRTYFVNRGIKYTCNTFLMKTSPITPKLVISASIFIKTYLFALVSTAYSSSLIPTSWNCSHTIFYFE